MTNDINAAQPEDPGFAHWGDRIAIFAAVSGVLAIVLLALVNLLGIIPKIGS